MRDQLPRRGGRTRMHLRGVIVALVVAALAVPGALAAAESHVETFVTFDPEAGEFPEGIAVDRSGRVYVSLMPANQIRRIDRRGGQTVLTEFDVPGLGPAGLAVNPTGTVYVAVSSLNLETRETDPATGGVYRVHQDGTSERLPGTAAILFPNDVALDKRGNVYATDTIGGAVWRISRRGSAEIWADHPLLKGGGAFGFGFPIGANGIAFRHNTIIVANTERGLLVAIPIEADGSAGAPTVLAESHDLVGIDGIALDVHGDVYAAVGMANRIVRIGDDGSIATLATADDGLNQPSTLTFGTGMGDRKTLFVANFSLLSPSPTPGILKLPVGQPGQPKP